jgi:hypothetical protein
MVQIRLTVRGLYVSMYDESVWNVLVRCRIVSKWAILHCPKALGESIEYVEEECFGNVSPSDISEQPHLQVETTYLIAL